jgi:hypothetical protein
MKKDPREDEISSREDLSRPKGDRIQPREDHFSPRFMRKDPREMARCARDVERGEQPLTDRGTTHRRAMRWAGALCGHGNKPGEIETDVPAWHEARAFFTLRGA